MVIPEIEIEIDARDFRRAVAVVADEEAEDAENRWAVTSTIARSVVEEAVRSVAEAEGDDRSTATWVPAAVADAGAVVRRAPAAIRDRCQVGTAWTWVRRRRHTVAVEAAVADAVVIMRGRLSPTRTRVGVSLRVDADVVAAGPRVSLWIDRSMGLRLTIAVETIAFLTAEVEEEAEGEAAVVVVVVAAAAAEEVEEDAVDSRLEMKDLAQAQWDARITCLLLVHLLGILTNAATGEEDLGVPWIGSKCPRLIRVVVRRRVIAVVAEVVRCLPAVAAGVGVRRAMGGRRRLCRLPAK